MASEEEQMQQAMKEEENRQQTMKIAQMTGAGAYIPPQDRYGSAITTLTNPDNDLYKFELFLRSLREDAKGELIEIGDPLLNERGINSVMATVQSVVHQMGSMTNYDEKDLDFYFDTLKGDLIHDLMVNRLAYKVDRKNRFLIVGNAMRFGWGFLKKSYHEGERKFWKGSVTEVKHTQQTDKSGFSLNPFNMLKGRG